MLVHGAWGSPEMWQWVVEELGDLRSSARIADLPTMQRADATLADDAAHVRDLAGDGPVVLCGHSYGATVVTEAGAGLPGLAHVLYLAGPIPDAGEDMFTWGSKRPIPGAAPLDFRDDGTAMVTVWAEDDGSYDAATLDRIRSCPPRPFAVAGAVTPLTGAAWRNVPSTAVVTLRDRTMHPDTQRETAERAGSDVIEIDAAHMVNLSHPAEVGAILTRICAADEA